MILLLRSQSRHWAMMFGGCLPTQQLCGTVLILGEAIMSALFLLLPYDD